MTYRHYGDCPSRSEAERSGRDDARRDGIFREDRTSHYREPFDCEDANREYWRAYGHEADRREEERRDEERREEEAAELAAARAAFDAQMAEEEMLRQEERALQEQANAYELSWLDEFGEREEF